MLGESPFEYYPLGLHDYRGTVPHSSPLMNSKFHPTDRRDRHSRFPQCHPRDLRASFIRRRVDKIPLEMLPLERIVLTLQLDIIVLVL